MNRSKDRHLDNSILDLLGSRCRVGSELGSNAGRCSQLGMLKDHRLLRPNRHHMHTKTKNRAKAVSFGLRGGHATVTTKKTEKDRKGHVHVGLHLHRVCKISIIGTSVRNKCACPQLFHSRQNVKAENNVRLPWSRVRTLARSQMNN